LAAISEPTASERAVLKCLLGLSRDETGVLAFASTTVAKQLGISQEEVESTIDQLVSRGYFSLLRAPQTSTAVRRVVDELNELDYEFLVGYVNPNHYIVRRGRVIEKVSNYGVSEDLIRMLSVSPKHATDAYQRLAGYLDRLEKMSELHEIDRGGAVARVLIEEYGKGITEARKLLDLFQLRLMDVSRDLHERREKGKTQLQELQIRFKVGEINEEQLKERQNALDEKLEELNLVGLALSSIMLNGEPLPEPPPEAAEQLELVEAKRVIGELDEKAYSESRSKAVREIKASRKPDHAFMDTLLETALSRASFERLEKLRKARLLSAQICKKLQKAIKSDQLAVQIVLDKKPVRKR
jgi:hypothetical protein